MTYLIDTDWVVDYLTEQQAALKLFTTLIPDGIGISIITFSEVFEGIYGSRDPRRAEQAFRAMLRVTDIYGINRAIAKRNARLRGQLRGQGAAIDYRALDLLIAATALERDLALVTRNLRHYQNIPGLRIYGSNGT